MTVRRKTLLIIAITCLGLVIVLYAASRSLLLGGFVKLEQTSARENVQRVLNAFDQDLSGMARYTSDHAADDELYNSIDHPGESVQSLMGEDSRGTPTTQRFSFVILTNVHARIVLARGRDILPDTVQVIPKSLEKHVSLTDPLMARSVMSGGLQGLLLLPEGPYLSPHIPSLRRARRVLHTATCLRHATSNLAAT